MHSTPQLARDLALIDRRRILRWLAGAAVIPVLPKLAACGSDSSAGACDTIPEETAGPYPGDGSNGPNALALSGIVRSDLRSSIAGASGTAQGVPLTVTLTLVDSGSSACAPLAGYAVYLWHADRDGNYSMYSSAVSGENYLRGVQVSDAEGKVSFTTVFPGCYDGRMPHMHFEVYASEADATGGGSVVATSQLALPEATCDEVYATTGYEASVTNFAKISFDSDNVFSDGVEQQLATVSGAVASGLVALLTVPVAA
jgi:protocatechuate 3,4-dioxygenase beta subunit